MFPDLRYIFRMPFGLFFCILPSFGLTPSPPGAEPGVYPITGPCGWDVCTVWGACRALRTDQKSSVSPCRKAPGCCVNNRPIKRCSRCEPGEFREGGRSLVNVKSGVASGAKSSGTPDRVALEPGGEDLFQLHESPPFPVTHHHPDPHSRHRLCRLHMVGL